MTTDTIDIDAQLQLNSYLKNNFIEGFAIKNFRERYLIPSSNNIFGGVQIEYILIDSGSNSSLFPLPMTLNNTFDINILLKNFPYDKHIWSIGTAHGAGLLPDTTLHIKPKESDDGSLCTIKCSLHVDIKPLEFQLPYIRFSLDEQSIKVLLETNEIPFSATEKGILRSRISFFNEFEKHFPSIRNTKKREYCLLGQHFLKNLCTIQINDTMVFVNKNKTHEKLFPLANTTVWAFRNILGDSPECCDYVLDIGILRPLLNIFSRNTRLTMIRNGGWCLTNLCRGKNPAVKFNKVASTLSVLSCLLYNLDSDVLADTY
ncbi:unnamed protein product [Rotaria sp. Silwood2]|nr:unnamed protein product [Rotaria sp. Silwood2]CAF3089976.1 unnamed protein product [Rotaria sp. Silwood2]CAF3335608.1 unnamed protein product [Rotaria sp. Silwood2]CAF4214363.1 unnamed protein product [Rotaria sp. Silwood2]CAF4439963.1 unnamed protein product [Rotaria sp. Silwood2]